MAKGRELRISQFRQRFLQSIDPHWRISSRRNSPLKRDLKIQFFEKSTECADYNLIIDSSFCGQMFCVCSRKKERETAAMMNGAERLANEGGGSVRRVRGGRGWSWMGGEWLRPTSNDPWRDATVDAVDSASNGKAGRRLLLMNGKWAGRCERHREGWWVE